MVTRRDEDSATTLWPLQDIRVGLRYRKDLGDLAPLEGSLALLGLLHPVVIQPDGTLVAGQRRLEAAKRRARVPMSHARRWFLWRDC